MKIVAFLQNQWFKNPRQVEAMIARSSDPEKHRQRFATRALFMGCLTGQRLLKSLGSETCNLIFWENASRVITDMASGSPPADLDHIRKVLAQQEPDLVIAFGKTATVALTDLVPAEQLLTGPHPASRSPDTIERLKTLAEEVRQRMEIFSRNA